VYTWYHDLPAWLRGVLHRTIDLQSCSRDAAGKTGWGALRSAPARPHLCHLWQPCAAVGVRVLSGHG